MNSRHLKSTACRALFLGAALWALPASAQHTFDGNILFNNTNPFTNLGGAACGANLIAFSHNDVGTDPLLGAPFFPNHNFVPAPGSIALGANDLVSTIQYAVTDTCPRPGCTPTRDFTQVCYRGAVPPAAMGADWTNEAWVCWPTAVGDVTCEPANQNFVFLSGPQPTSTWTANNTYVLQGKVSFPVGTQLTIQAGTKILGENATNGYLVIDRGAKIFSNGTSTSPVVMTSDQNPPVPGSWGGLVIHGRAISNCADCLGGASCVSEGGAGDHCGTDDCDDSGVVMYTRVQYSGIVISANNELNSFTFNSVGNGTDLHHLEAILGTDDAFEWFGGNCNANHLIAHTASDDSFDWQMGFRGTVQFGVIQQSSLQVCDKGIEADNNEFNFNAVCRSNPLIANVTFIAGGGAAAIHLRRGTDAHIFNSIIQGWPTAVRVEHAETCARGVNAQPPPANCNANGVDVFANGGMELELRTMPNPVVASAQFQFQLPNATQAKLDVFDVTGRLVANVLDRKLHAGSHSVSWNPASNVSAGAYFVRLQADANEPVLGKLTLVR